MVLHTASTHAALFHRTAYPCPHFRRNLLTSCWSFHGKRKHSLYCRPFAKLAELGFPSTWSCGRSRCSARRHTRLVPAGRWSGTTVTPKVGSIHAICLLRAALGLPYSTSSTQYFLWNTTTLNTAATISTTTAITTTDTTTTTHTHLTLLAC